MATSSSSTVFLIKFYVPWCKFCQTLEPIFADAARDFARDHPDTDVVFAKVDVSEEEALRNVFGIEQFPTLKILIGGSHPKDAYDYHATHDTADEIVRYVAAK